MTSSSRRGAGSRRRNHRRHPMTSSKSQRHVTESPGATSSGTPRTVTSSADSPVSVSPGTSPRESPPRAVTSSSGNPPPGPVTSSAEVPPRGRTASKHSSHQRTESPGVTSSGKPRETPVRATREPRTSGNECPFLQSTCERLETRRRPDHLSCSVRSTSVPPASALPSSNPFSPLWNFLFKDRRATRWTEDSDNEEHHVCNTAQRSPRNSWFTGHTYL